MSRGPAWIVSRRLMIGALALAIAGRGSAQNTPSRLGLPNGKLSAEFTAVTSLRELSDGRVLLTDPIERRLVVGDFRTGTVRQVGRVGNGPREYPLPVPVVATSGDSSLMLDGLSRRGLLLHRDSIVGMLPPDAKLLETPMQYGADRLGNVLTNESPPMDKAGHPLRPTDSLYLVLVARKSAKRDTIARLWMGRFVPAGKRRGYSQYDVAMLANDGWVAVLRLDPYRVDWRSPVGKWILGRPLAVRTERLTQAHKEAFMRRSLGQTPEPVSAIADWPEYFPIWDVGMPLLITGDGMLAVPRRASVANPGQRYDIIDRRGQLVRQLRLDDGQKFIAGFGTSSVYVVTRDADDVLRVQRHAWP